MLLALIQGITEFLPISSSAHLILPSQLLGWPDQGLAFDIAVHAGSLLAVLVYFRHTLTGMAGGAWIGVTERRMNADLHLGLMVVLATLPVIVAGFALKDFVESQLRSTLVIATTTIVFGLLLGLADRRAGVRDEYAITATMALLIGLAQALALVPGTSRSGITITAALLLGLSRPGAARFSFLLSIPAILGAGVLALADALDSDEPVDWQVITIGTGAAAISAYACIHLFIRWIERIGMLPFVIYRLLLGAVLFGLLAAA